MYLVSYNIFKTKEKHLHSMCIQPNVNACIFFFTYFDENPFSKHRSNPVVICDHINTSVAETAYSYRSSCRNFYSGTLYSQLVQWLRNTDTHTGTGKKRRDLYGPVAELTA